MQAVVDRIEGKFVVLRFEDGQELKANSKGLAACGVIKEGMAIDVEFKINRSKTANKRKTLEKLLKKVFERNRVTS